MEENIMPLAALVVPHTDPTPIFEIFRGSFGTELLTAAVAHFRVFDCLRAGALSFEQLRHALHLAHRPATVLITALQAFGLLESDLQGRLAPTLLAREHLMRTAPFNVSDYLGLAATNPG